nr:MAG TPA: hypothetical protein [Caudoviricetes sp.]
MEKLSLYLNIDIGILWWWEDWWVLRHRERTD